MEGEATPPMASYVRQEPATTCGTAGHMPDPHYGQPSERVLTSDGCNVACDLTGPCLPDLRQRREKSATRYGTTAHVTDPRHSQPPEQVRDNRRSATWGRNGGTCLPGDVRHAGMNRTRRVEWLVTCRTSTTASHPDRCGTGAATYCPPHGTGRMSPHAGRRAVNRNGSCA